MKKFTKALAVFLALIMTFSTFAMAGAADSSDSVTVKMMNFNVAGLPNFGGILGLNDVDISANQKVAAAYMNENDFDIVAVQEDFGYHKSLVSSLEGYNYLTNHTGSFLGGDGMNIFTKNMPIYNETRNKWNASSGVIEDGADELANKGILYAVIDIGNGIYVDFYDIHADAYDSEKDQAAREDNYRQVTDLINANYEKNNRPVVITGDFNHFFHATDKQNSNIRHYFIEKCGLRDAWVELYNGCYYLLTICLLIL